MKIEFTELTTGAHAYVMAKRSADAQSKYGTNSLIIFEEGNCCTMYGNAAKTASEVLGRCQIFIGQIPHLIFPHRALDIYLPKFVRAGYRIIIYQKGTF